ncbi:DUF429 domain-containing protein [Acidobacteria bacterium AH-259-D05]|nr:DUF429 domain-containing protein [Acidobacteria bacterium AH-259-D05]
MKKKERENLYVLGVDSAWTSRENSAVALVKLGRTGRTTCVGRSYREFVTALQGSAPNWLEKPEHDGDFRVVLDALLDKGINPCAIALDLPLSPASITGRRVADQEISKRYGSKGAAAHTPTKNRPGRISQDTFSALHKRGYRFAGADMAQAECPLFFETYPHPAIVELLDRDYRLPYKVSRRRNYWREETPLKRWELLLDSFERLWTGLNEQVTDLENVLPKPVALSKAKHRGAPYKGYEDALDAVVCAWVGIQFLKGNCNAYGDKTSCIWIPRRR